MNIHFTFGTNNLARTVRFHDVVFAVLEQPRLPDWPVGWAGWGSDCDDGTMVGFPARDAAQVCALHAAGLTHGGTGDGTPGTRPCYTPDFHVACLRDPDGNKPLVSIRITRPGRIARWETENPRPIRPI
ncbi:VOC family protein [Ruegeria marina]|uniref:VOC domain-containing protein n=1 Tax=Ruegeria marina TaxID=639004 RepID=A0A1G6RT78_9RHOB|nr:VOC family protein [Ruegeria marina]SDD07187.1 hypothetical protein SAMN04488239_10549 [Ruegeria marina]